jgi:hypothetical protein
MILRFFSYGVSRFYQISMMISKEFASLEILKLWLAKELAIYC